MKSIYEPLLRQTAQCAIPREVPRNPSDLIKPVMSTQSQVNKVQKQVRSVAIVTDKILVTGSHQVSSAYCFKGNRPCMWDFLQAADRLKRDLYRCELVQPPALMLESMAMRYRQIASRAIGALRIQDLEGAKCFHALKREIKRQGKVCTHPFGKGPLMMGGVFEMNLAPADVNAAAGAPRMKGKKAPIWHEKMEKMQCQWCPMREQFERQNKKH